MADSAAIVESGRSKILAATLIGNFMEWFDFAVYGFVATIIGANFFPTTDDTTALLSSLAVFGVAFFFRPVGGAIFGYIGDRFGRRTSLASAIIIMAVSTALVGLLPTYAAVGVAAPVLLVVIRCVQGISVGGEWTGSSTFLVEYSPPDKRGRWASLISSTAAFGMILGSGMVYLLSVNLSADAMNSWGWRIPFLFSLPLGAAGLYLRLRLEDTPVVRILAERGEAFQSPFKNMGKRHIGAIALAFAFSSATGVGFYYFATYFNNYLSETAGFDRPSAILLSLVSLAIYAVVFCPLAGWLSDKVGRKRIYVAGSIGHAVLAVPLFLMLSTGEWGLALLALAIYAVPQSMLNVMSSVTIVEVFPPKIRLTAGSIGYNLGVGPVAGTGPLVAAALVAATGNAIAPAYYLAAITAVVAVVLIVFLPETFRRSLAVDYSRKISSGLEPTPTAPTEPEPIQP